MKNNIFSLYEDIITAFNDGKIGLYEYCKRLAERSFFIECGNCGCRTYKK